MKLQDNLNDVTLSKPYEYNRIWFRRVSKDHHINGPAFIQSTGFKTYSIDGVNHNPKGPAILWPGGTAYFLNGKRLSEEEWHEARR